MPASIQKPRSTPDLQKLMHMGSPILQISKVNKAGANTLVVNARKASTDDIVGYMSSLPQTNGPGTYQFEVVDESGDMKDVWTAKLGNPVEEPPMTFNGYTPQQIAGAAGTVDIGPYKYNSDLSLLVAPDGTVEVWRPGQELPKFGAAKNNGTAATPIAPWAGWGQMPAATPTPSGENEEIKLLKMQLDEQKQARLAEEHRREIGELRSGFEKAVEAVVNATNDKIGQLADLIKTVAEDKKPNAESEGLKEQLRLQQQQRMEDQFRNTVSLLEAKISENKADPMLPMLIEMIRASQTTVASQMQANRESMQLIADRFSSSSMTPEKTLEIVQAAKDRGPENVLNTQMIDMFSKLFGMAQELVKTKAELESDGMSPGMAMLREGIEKVGVIAQTYAEKKAESETAAQVMEHRRQMAMAHQARQRAAQAQQQAAGQPQQPVAPGAPAPTPQPVPEPVPEPPTDGEGETAPAAVQETAATAEQMKEAAAAKIFQGADKPPAEKPGDAKPDKETKPNKKPGKKIVAIEEISEDAIRDHVNENFDDEKLFGVALPHVKNLRARVTAGAITPAQCAEYVHESETQLASFGKLPPAIELLENGHTTVFVERLLPEATDDYRAQVVAHLEDEEDEKDDSGDTPEPAGALPAAETAA